MRLDVVYNDLRQLPGFGVRWSAGLPFWRRKLLANGGKPDDYASAKVSESVQLRIFWSGLPQVPCSREIWR